MGGQRRRPVNGELNDPRRSSDPPAAQPPNDPHADNDMATAGRRSHCGETTNKASGHDNALLRDLNAAARASTGIGTSGQAADASAAKLPANKLDGRKR